MQSAISKYWWSAAAKYTHLARAGIRHVPLRFHLRSHISFLLTMIWECDPAPWPPYREHGRLWCPHDCPIRCHAVTAAQQSTRGRQKWFYEGILEKCREKTYDFPPRERSLQRLCKLRCLPIHPIPSLFLWEIHHHQRFGEHEWEVFFGDEWGSPIVRQFPSWCNWQLSSLLYHVQWRAVNEPKELIVKHLGTKEGEISYLGRDAVFPSELLHHSGSKAFMGDIFVELAKVAHWRSDRSDTFCDNPFLQKNKPVRSRIQSIMRRQNMDQACGKGFIWKSMWVRWARRTKTYMTISTSDIRPNLRWRRANIGGEEFSSWIWIDLLSEGVKPLRGC